MMGGVVAFPFGLLAAMEKYTFRTEGLFNFGGHTVALIPGLPGNYVRAAYYMMTLDYYHPTAVISFGSFFAHRTVRIGSRAGIGAYCVIGMTIIGKETRIASRVSIISGLHTHGASGDIGTDTSKKGAMTPIAIGESCWIGEGAVVAADVGNNAIVGVGAVVMNTVPDNNLAMGNPARLLPTKVKPPDPAQRQ